MASISNGSVPPRPASRWRSGGRSAIASRLPGATDAAIDDGRNGLLVAPGDVDALASAIDTVLTDRERAAALGAAARRRVEAEFGADRTASGWLDAYESVVGD